MWRLGFLFALLFAEPLQAADLAITVHGLRSDAGQLRLAIFDKAKEFPRGEKIHNRDIAAKAGDIIVVFKNVAPGAYALAIHHDENINKSMDTNFSVCLGKVMVFQIMHVCCLVHRLLRQPLLMLAAKMPRFPCVLSIN
jgi:hypothetical protein